jgi:hypothetical protein
MAAPIRGAGAVVEVQGVAVGHGCGVEEADALGVTSLGVCDGLDDAVSDGDGDSEAIDGRGAGERRRWIARPIVPDVRMKMETGMAQRRGCRPTQFFKVSPPV